MCLDPVAASAEDLRDLGRPQQADLATRRPRRFSEQLDKQFGCARDGHRCASVAKSEIQTPYDLRPSDQAVSGTNRAEVPRRPTASGLGQRCPKLPAESGWFRVLAGACHTQTRAFPCK